MLKGTMSREKAAIQDIRADVSILKGQPPCAECSKRASATIWFADTEVDDLLARS
jgi:hypothetical protein